MVNQKPKLPVDETSVKIHQARHFVNSCWRTNKFEFLHTCWRSFKKRNSDSCIHSINRIDSTVRACFIKENSPSLRFKCSFVRPFINDRDTLTKGTNSGTKYCNTRTVRAHINKAFSAQFGKLSRSRCLHQGCLLSLRTRQSCCNGRERLPKQIVDLPSAGIS